MADVDHDTPDNQTHKKRQNENADSKNNRCDQIIREVQPLLHMTPPSVCVKGLDGCSHVAPSQTRIREKQVIFTPAFGSQKILWPPWKAQVFRNGDFHAPLDKFSPRIKSPRRFSFFPSLEICNGNASA